MTTADKYLRLGGGLDEDVGTGDTVTDFTNWWADTDKTIEDAGDVMIELIDIMGNRQATFEGSSTEVESQVAPTVLAYATYYSFDSTQFTFMDNIISYLEGLEPPIK